jgi:hypothetical protein
LIIERKSAPTERLIGGIVASALLRLLVLPLWLAVLAGPWSGGIASVAQTTSPGERLASPSPLRPSGQGANGPKEIPLEEATGCDQPIKQATEGSSSAVVVELDPDTVWRPRGAEVRFFIRGSGGTVAVQSVQVCFAWSPTSADPGTHYLISPLVRGISNTEGKIEYGATVPGLSSAEPWWPRRPFGESAMRFTGLWIVPVANMQVLARVLLPGQNDAVPVAVVLPVGVTSVFGALVLVLVALGTALYVLYSFGRHRNLPGGDPFLKVISNRWGFASLSQFQIMLWTVVVGTAGIYVMALSGNLISITSGTLVLLGISGATTLLARLAPSKKLGSSDSNGNGDGGQNGSGAADIGADAHGVAVDADLAAARSAASSVAAAATGDADGAAAHAAAASAQAARAVSAQTLADSARGSNVAHPAQSARTTAAPFSLHAPRWSDLVVVDGETDEEEIDVTRVQMLVFTVISAAFVAIKVLNSYEIPEIPSGFLVLMGISNGVYVTGKHLTGPGRLKAGS